MAANPLISFRADASLTGWLAWPETRSASEQARTELVMFRTLADLALAATPVPLAWASCIADIMAGSALTDLLGSLLAHTLIDGFTADDRFDLPSPYPHKWGIDSAEMVVWALDLSPLADYAWRRAVARWWAIDAAPTTEGFATVGIVVTS